MPAVVAIGEALGDLVPDRRGMYELHPGGAVANVAVNLSRWGIGCGLVTRVGSDFVGDFLIEFLRRNGVDVRFVRRKPRARTGLVFVSLDERGERDFTFYGRPSADQFVSTRDVTSAYIRSCRVLHFGSISMMSPSARAATLKAIRIARRLGRTVTYDANVRLNLWERRHGAARRQIRTLYRHADVVKLSVEELRFLFDASAESPRLTRIFAPHQIVFITGGQDGCHVRRGSFTTHAPARLVKPVDTTGAGDAFMAGVIHGIVTRNRRLDELTVNDLVEIACSANEKGAAAVLRRGAV